MQTIHALLQELGKLINIPGLALDDDQTCTLDIDGQPCAGWKKATPCLPMAC